MFPGELYWREYTKCAGFKASRDECDYRWNEMKLLMYTPSACLDGSLTFSCESLIAYSRISTKSSQIDMAGL